MWLSQLTDRNRQCFPDRVALVDEHRSVTWAQFHERTVRLARGWGLSASPPVTGWWCSRWTASRCWRPTSRWPGSARCSCRSTTV
ncbi:hypothetical protein ACFQ0M_39095 [Kitasatospora aburaviensis]